LLDATPQTAVSGNCLKCQQAIKVDWRSVTAFGTVCWQPDGSWRAAAPWRRKSTRLPVEHIVRIAKAV
jgi:hypothetical protein